MKEKLQKLNKKINDTISKATFVMEIVFFIGLIIINTTNFMLNFYVGMYFLGLTLLAYSIFLYKFKAWEVKKK